MVSTLRNVVLILTVPSTLLVALVGFRVALTICEDIWLPEPAAQQHARDDVSTSLGFLWSVVPTKLFWEAHGARTVRLPTWVELFGHRGGDS